MAMIIPKSGPDLLLTERINARLAEVRAETERMRREAEQQIEERREQAAFLPGCGDDSGVLAGAFALTAGPFCDIVDNRKKCRDPAGSAKKKPKREGKIDGYPYRRGSESLSQL